MRTPMLAMDTAESRPQSKLRVLWLACPDYSLRVAHGGNLRLFNYARELVSQGHEVFLAVLKRKTDVEDERKNCLNELKQEKIITDFFELEYHHPRLRGKLSRLLFHPALVNRSLRKQQAPVVDAIRQTIVGKEINICVCSARDFLFVLPRIKEEVKSIIDWVDSYFLYHVRELQLHVKKLRVLRLLRSLRLLADAFVEERYYGRQCALNLTVSPIDKKYLDFATGTPRQNQFLLNGVVPQVTNGISKIKGRLIFTGNMDFPPNYESAIWFIDRVFPLLRERSDVRLVIAGANPVRELVERSSEQIEVIGYTENLRREIARSQLYVAPLVCGGGFKNKVVEAITSGTYLVGTSLAVEFLGAKMRRLLTVADTPRHMADAILTYLRAPQDFASRLETLKEIVDDEFTWKNRSKEFIETLRKLAR